MSKSGPSSFAKGMMKVFGIPIVVALVFVLFRLGSIYVFEATKMPESIEIAGQSYLSKTLPKILSSWSMAELEMEAGPELPKLREAQDVTALFERNSQKLGKIKNLGPPVKTAMKSYYDLGKKRFRTEYRFQATFEKGNADVTCAVIRSKGTWHIASIAIGQSSKP